MPKFFLKVEFSIVREDFGTIHHQEGRFPIKSGSGLEWVKAICGKLLDAIELIIVRENDK